MTPWRPVAVVTAALLALAACGDDGADSSSDTAPSSLSAPTTTTSVPPVARAAALCGARIEPTGDRMVANDELLEVSGLAASRRHDGVLWTHNDSGDSARVFAVGLDGTDRGRAELAGIEAVDIEDMAIGPSATGDGDDLYIADIGDNAGQRESVTVHRFAEPDPVAGGDGPTVIPAAAVETIELFYPDGPRDAESLIVDPRTGDLVIVHKRFGGGAEVYRASPAVNGRADLVKIGVLGLDTGAPVELSPNLPPLALAASTATGADIDASGSVIAIRTYGTVYVWPRDADQGVAAALVDNEPCEAPSLPEEQGEALAVLADGGGYVTISEGSQPPVNLFTARTP